MPASESERQFLEAEHLVELRSANLRKELRLRDLVAIQVLYIVGLYGSARPPKWAPRISCSGWEQ